MRHALRAVAGLGLALMLAIGVPLAAQAATYPPATTGTFSVTAHAGSNRITVNGLGPHAAATAIISGSGPAPTLGAFDAAVRSATVNLAVGQTDADGSVAFTLVFPDDAVGVYNASVSTPDGHSVSGVITVPSKSGSALAWTGTNIAMWVVWLAGILVALGIAALVIAAVRRRSRN
ncbi:hypothetical protein D7I44_12005 [Gryllotalpicola protaetiae]|uniref:Sortase n=2 Tax=Gryllotalpicola protaetiae TaxID=2419771 RepID=A0A387BK07_9MICO|nr:hypothetical protein D7I44_12005 [Gryllotalpicola protaetiae]